MGDSPLCHPTSSVPQNSPRLAITKQFKKKNETRDICIEIVSDLQGCKMQKKEKRERMIL